MSLMEWVLSVLTPNARRPPEILGADEPEIIAASEQAAAKREKTIEVSRRYGMIQDKRLRQVQRRLDRVAQLTAEMDVLGETSS